MRLKEQNKMASRGLAENSELQQNLQDQLERLVSQLSDLEEYKDELDPDEYDETKNETLEQLKEFNASLSKMISGDMTLVDKYGGMQLAIQGAISKAFKTPEVIQMFAKKQQGQLRDRLCDLERASVIGKFPADTIMQQKLEILTALKKLGEALSPAEESFLQQHINIAFKEFEQISAENGPSDKILEMASNQVKAVSG